MFERPIALIGAFAFALAIHAQDASLRYPFFPKPKVMIENLGEGVRVTTDAGTNALVTILSGDSVTGPQEIASEIMSLNGSQKFFTAKVETSLIRFENVFVGVRFIAIRLPTLDTATEITTKSGFRLSIQLKNWFNDISIFRVDDGPTTGDPAADYVKLFNDLWTDERTDFVAPVTPTQTTGLLCFMGYGDELLIRPRDPEYTAAEFDQHNLALVEQIPGWLVVKWLRPKACG